MNRISGEVIWERHRGRSLYLDESLIFYKELVLMPGKDSLEVINEKTGDIKWRFDTGGLSLMKVLLSRENAILVLCGSKGCRGLVLDLEKGGKMAQESKKWWSN